MIEGQSRQELKLQDVKSVSFHRTAEIVNPFCENLPLCNPEESSCEELACAFVIPIYAYDIPLSSLTTIREASEETGEELAQGDIIQDFTQISVTQYPNSQFLLEDLPRAMEGTTHGRFGSSKHLAVHCSAIHDLFFHSFVLSIFSSLQRGQNVNNRDMQSAVDEICEENFVEIDITDFIRTLCGHYAKRWAGYHSNSEQNSSKEIAEYLSGTCESVSGLHESVTSKFALIMSRYFKRVPTNQDFFYFSPQVTESNRKVSFCSKFMPIDLFYSNFNVC